jgi:hypothetical protein
MIFCGRIIYEDIFDVEYAQRFCYLYRYPINLPQEVSECPTANDEILTDYVAESRRSRPPRPPIYFPEIQHHEF